MNAPASEAARAPRFRKFLGRLYAMALFPRSQAYAWTHDEA